jgi:hypothetical protein
MIGTVVEDGFSLILRQKIQNLIKSKSEWYLTLGITLTLTLGTNNPNNPS